MIDAHWGLFIVSMRKPPTAFDGVGQAGSARQIVFSVLVVWVASVKKRRDSPGDQNDQERNNRKFNLNPREA